MPHPFDTEIPECQFIGLGWRESNERQHAETPDKAAAVICAPRGDNHPAPVSHAPAMGARRQMTDIVGRAQLRRLQGGEAGHASPLAPRARSAVRSAASVVLMPDWSE